MALRCKRDDHDAVNNANYRKYIGVFKLLNHK